MELNKDNNSGRSSSRQQQKNYTKNNIKTQDKYQILHSYKVNDVNAEEEVADDDAKQICVVAATAMQQWQRHQ